MRFDVFSPYSVIAALLIYLALAISGTLMGIRGLKLPSGASILYIALGATIFILGAHISGKIPTEKHDRPGNLGETLLLLLVTAGILLQLLNLYLLGGIPLLSGHLKARAVTKIWLLSYIIFLPSVNMLLAVYPRRRYYIPLILGAALFALTGYRTTVVVILLSGIITIYYSARPSSRQIALLLSALAIVAIAVGYIAVKSIEWQTWTLNPLELLLYRAGYTLMVFDRLLDHQGATGGELLYYTLTGYLHSTDPRAIVGEAVLGYRHSTTSLIFGPPLLDFGLPAMVIQMFLLGLILGSMHRIQIALNGIFTGIYSVILAHTIIWVETGPTDLVVWLFYMVAVISIIYVLWRCYPETGSCS
ncbi:oligosaccharide repeat unit polymerase family protein [Methanothermobacter sp. K4]|uniref:oligosaccharide repeat unit polymerase family protein n=1 Tax=Methanothermobacter sp. K4 TaxID=2913262 RepID=UPI001ED9CED5|nr:oligosaccharide repeat unit polymerase family protein [Methanothermobacter sp. K4]MCG2827904.1 oligosaccharide repeat unit polymerase family protein [Methanothermobacter sp. K4]